MAYTILAICQDTFIALQPSSSNLLSSFTQQFFGVPPWIAAKYLLYAQVHLLPQHFHHLFYRPSRLYDCGSVSQLFRPQHQLLLLHHQSQFL
jgi:hypothetical protein